MKIVLAALAGVSLMAAASAASAQVYGNIGYSQVSADDLDLGAVSGRVGYDINQYVSVEGEALVGVKDDSVNVPPVVDVELKHFAAGFVVGRLPVGEGFEVFARAGYGTIKVEASSGAYSAAGSDDGFVYGLGAQYNFGANGVRADYTKYGDDVDGFGVSFVRKF